jgi:hypothetical protein
MISKDILILNLIKGTIMNYVKAAIVIALFIAYIIGMFLLGYSIGALMMTLFVGASIKIAINAFMGAVIALITADVLYAITKHVYNTKDLKQEKEAAAFNASQGFTQYSV